MLSIVFKQQPLRGEISGRRKNVIWGDLAPNLGLTP